MKSTPWMSKVKCQHSTWLLIVLLVSTTLLTASCNQDQSVAPTGQWIQTVEVFQPLRRDMEEVRRYPCHIRPAQQHVVTSKLSGRVSEVFVDLADEIEAGAPLFSLDTVDVMNNIRILQAQLVAAEAAVQSARTGVTLATGTQLQGQIIQATGGAALADAGVEQARIAYAQSSIGLDNAAQLLEQATLAHNDLLQEHQAFLRLLEIGEGTRRQLEQLELGLEQSAIRVSQTELGLHQASLTQDQARIALTQAEAGQVQALGSLNLLLGEAPTEALQRANDGLNQAIAARDAIQAQINIAQSVVADAHVLSPITGVIASRGVEEWMLIGPATVAFVVIDVATVYANIHVSEHLVSSLATGQEAPVFIRAIQEEPFFGTIEVISPAAGAGGAFEVRIALENLHSRIRPGMYAEVHLVINSQEQVLVVPRGAVLEDGETSFVFIIEEGYARKTPVVTGIETGNEIAILSGLSDTDQVVVRGQRGLSDGVPVSITG